MIGINRKHYLSFGKFVLIPILLGLLIFGFFISNLNVIQVRASISLLYFRAVPKIGKILLEWETATELDNSGFYIQRSNSRTGNYTRINNSIILANGDSLVGAKYNYEDSNVSNGTTYWYRLESLDTSQNSQFTEPLSAIPLGPTPTSSITITATILVSTYTTTPSMTIRPSKTGTITSTPVEVNPYPAPNNPTETLLPEVSSTPISQEFVEPTPVSTQTTLNTPTLLPFPTVTIEFPTKIPTEPLKVNSQNIEVPVKSSGIQDGKQHPYQFWLIGVLVFIWLILCGWFLVIYKRFRN